MTKLKSTKQVPLTTFAIKHMKPGEELADSGEYRGLRVTRTLGGHRFWYRYNDPLTGKQKAHLIGHFESMSLAEARSKFVQLKAQRRQGVSPAAQAIADKPSKAEVPPYTVRAMVEDYLATLTKRRKPKAVSEARRVLSRCVLADLGDLKVGDVTVEHCLNLASKELELGHSAQCGVFLREFKRAIDQAMLVDKLPLTHTNPTSVAIRLLTQQGHRLTSKARKRYLTDSEIAMFMQWLPESAFTPKQQIALRLSLETGCRSGEAMGASWRNFDMDRGEWSLPKTKTDEPRVVRLSRQTRGWLRDLKEVSSSSWLCPSPSTKSHIQQKSLTESMWRMRQNGRMLKIDSWVPHDIRRTVRTGLARLGCPRAVAEAILGHSSGGIIGVYDQHGYEAEAGTWLQRWNDHLDSLSMLDASYRVVSPK
jgi:integrase